MQYIVNLVNDGDVCALGFLIGIGFVIGGYAVQHQRELNTWGQRVAGMAFLAYVVYGWQAFHPAAAIDWLGIVFRGLLAAGLTLGTSWILLAAAAFGYRVLLAGPAAHTQRAGASIWQRMAALRRERHADAARRQSQAEWERSRPERERAEREYALQRREEAKCAAENAKRREDALVACELLYNLRAPSIGSRFTREQFDSFLKKFMGADKSTVVVEQRATELQTLIQKHYDAVSPPTKFSDLAGIAAWYQGQMEQIGALPVGESYKKAFFVQLNERYVELTQETLEKL